MIALVSLAWATPPTFDVERGIHEAPFTLTLTGDDVHYSVDGGSPETPYSTPIPIAGTTIVRARDGESAVTTHTYLFLDDVLEQDVLDATLTQDAALGPRIRATLQDLPSVSIVGGDLTTSEGAVSFEYVDPDGLSVQADCGAARVGGHSLSYPKNNVRLYFRAEYGVGRLEADFFEDVGHTGVPPLSDHDSLDLRGGSHDSSFYLGARGQHLRNIWMDETELEMGHIAPHGRFVHVYLNGEYTGLYQLRERFDAAMMSEHLGGSEDDYGAVNGGRSVDGDGVAWAAIDASVSDFDTFRQWVDVPQYLDYLVLNLFAANRWDWNPAQNWMAAGPNDAVSGWIFHSSDSDICLWYDPTTWTLDSVGPAYSFSSLLAEGHPDFQVALMDALHRNLSEGGALSSPVASDRYARLAAGIEDAVIAEAARWGGGAWDPVGDWTSERDNLVDVWLPTRADAFREDVVEAGWLPLDAPTFLPTPGAVEAGTTVRIGGPGTLWVRTDGGDPRLDGGGVAPQAVDASAGFEETLTRGRSYAARSQVDGVWGPLATGRYTVGAGSPVVLNEWNAVGPNKHLADGDSALGDVEGNGGDWLELLVVEDVDLRGARLEMWDAYGDLGTVTFGDDDAFEVRAGTLITVAEDLPQDLAYDPDGGDWRFHVRADLDVTHSDWQLAIWDADDRLLHGPVGEGVVVDGLSSNEVGLLAATPSDPRALGTWQTGERSTYGSPNAWDGGEQDLSRLRGEPVDTGVWDTDAVTTPGDPAPGGCGEGRAAVVVLLGLLLLRRRAPLVAPVLLLGCAEPLQDSAAQETAPPTDCFAGPEVCNGLDDDCDGQVDEDPVDGLPFFVDDDGDGFGAGSALACAAGDGLALLDGDCDDGDATVHPGAPELCDAIDQDCDGHADDALGASEACPADTCGDDGATWMTLPSGSTAQLWCEDGWRVGFLRNSAATGSQGDFGSGEEGLDQLGVNPADASASSTPARAWIDLNDLDWSELQVASYASGAETWRSTSIPRSAIRIPFGDDGYRLYGEEGYYWCGGDASYTDGQVGAVDNPGDAPLGCRGHGSLGSGWDFSESTAANQGLTLCGGDGSNFIAGSWGGTWVSYGTVGAAQAIWVR